MKGDSTATYTSWGCHAVGPAGRDIHEQVAGGPRSIVGATQKPPGKGLPTGVRENGTHWMYAAKRRSARGTWRTATSFGIGSNRGRRREGQWRRKRHPGSGTRPEGTRAGLVMTHVVAANGKPPITALGKNRRPSIGIKKQETRQRTGIAVETRPDFLGPPPTAAAKMGSSFGPTPSAISGRQRCIPRGPARKRRGVSLLNWNVGLDYTARWPNCQSANAFVEPRQTRAPRLRNALSNTEPRVSSHPLASRANSRPRSAPSTMA
jgi:hypothetical protein